MAAGRGALLLAVAVFLGVVLLNAAEDGPAQRVTTGEEPSAQEPGPGTEAPDTTSTTAPIRAPKDVKVLSANGTPVQGAAGRVRDALRAQGYNVLAPLDARPAQTSAVYYTPTFEREAEAIAQALALPSSAVQPVPNPPPVPQLREANVVVVVGPELAQRLARAATTTTTARARTTTTRRPTTTTTTAPAPAPQPQPG
jgi:hypothetical protein